MGGNLNGRTTTLSWTDDVKRAVTEKKLALKRLIGHKTTANLEAYLIRKREAALVVKKAQSDSWITLLPDPHIRS